MAKQILHIPINEFNDNDSLIDAVVNYPYKSPHEGGIITSSKESAENYLKKVGNKHRIFWKVKVEFNGIETFMLYEAIYD